MEIFAITEMGKQAKNNDISVTHYYLVQIEVRYDTKFSRVLSVT